MTMRHVLATVMLSLSLASFHSAAVEQSKSGKNAQQTKSPSEMTLEENLLTPTVPDKQHNSIAGSMRREAESLHRQGYHVETMRKGEIVIVSIPTDNLFSPNDTALIHASADKLLKPFTVYLDQPGKYKVLMAVHTDDTGSARYTFDLSENRILSLYDWFDTHVANDDSLLGFPMGDTAPAVDNDTRVNRAKNRRLEIYIVPDEGLINASKRKR